MKEWYNQSKLVTTELIKSWYSHSYHQLEKALSYEDF